MSTSSSLSGPRALELVLAAAAPVSLDRLVELRVERPSALWRWLDEAGSAGAVAETATAGSFAFSDEARRMQVLASASADEWRALTELDGLVPAMIDAARDDLRSRRFQTAAAILRALVASPRREAFPGGPRGWSEVVADCVRTFAFDDRVDAVTLDEALAIAVAAGDLRLQAVLAAARGFTATKLEPAGEAARWFERALDAAHATGDRAVEFDVHVRVAYGQVLQGRVHEAIATFERLLGDVPEEYLPLPTQLAPAFSALPEAPLGVLGSMYGQIGQYGRGIDMLHRMCEVGERLGRAELVAMGQTFLAGLYGARRDMDAVRAHAEPAFDYWKSAGAEPWLLWHTSHQLALARVAEGRLADARAILELGHRARVASGIGWFGGSALFEALDRFDVERAKAPEGLDVDAEIEGMLRWPGGYMRGVALRYRARRLSRGPLDDARAEEVSRALAESVELLRSTRSSPIELSRSLEDAARWAAQRGRTGEADRLSAEAREIQIALDLEAARGGVVERTIPALVELGRLGALGERKEGVWGDVAARLCAATGAERCALVEASPDGARALGVRGGSPAWVAAVLRRAAASNAAVAETGAPLSSAEDAASPGGQLLIVPFAAAALGRSGWAFLENRRSRAALSRSDAVVLQILGAQLGVVLENVALWQELSAARTRLEGENRYYRDAAPAPRRGPLVGESPALRRVLELVERVAPATTSVLVHGETGVGKELIAREIHRLSPRAGRPFIAVHIAALPATLVSSALFGHERGAFTGATEQSRGRFELADGGTLFLDEIGELGAEDQVRLLRVLQEGTFERVGGTRAIRSDFRLLAATNRDLAAEVRAGRFREDLYFRLAAFPLRVPPLRERTEEIPALALHFMETYARKRGLDFEGIGEADVARLRAYRWPGNVRELEHVIERAVLLSDPPRLRVPPLGEEEHIAGPAAPGGSSTPAGEWVTLEEQERRYLRRLIEHTHGRVTGAGGAAEIAGLKPSTLTWRIGRLGLRPELQRARAARGLATGRAGGPSGG